MLTTNVKYVYSYNMVVWEEFVLRKAWLFFLILAITLSLSYAAGALLEKTLYYVQPVIDRL